MRAAGRYSTRAANRRHVSSIDIFSGTLRGLTCIPGARSTMSGASIDARDTLALLELVFLKYPLILHCTP